MLRELVSSIIMSAVLFSSAFGKYKVMVVPGHDNRAISERVVGKAGNEAKIALSIASKLEEKLKKGGIEVFVTRDDKGYKKEILDCMKNSSDEFDFFVSNSNGDSANAAYKKMLFAMAKHANESGFDLIVNLHLNDVSKKSQEFSGFSVYYSTITFQSESKYLALSMKNELKKYFKPSNNLGEKPVNKSKKFIMLGTSLYPLNVPSNIVEFGYIDEEKWAYKSTHEKGADAAYKAIKNYIRHHRK